MAARTDFAFGFPTGQELRGSDPLVQYLVGTPKRLTALERALPQKPWIKAREDVRVKLLAQDRELYAFADSRDRIGKGRRMRRRQQSAAAWPLVSIELPVQGTAAVAGDTQARTAMAAAAENHRRPSRFRHPL